ncbi:hypothetical protein BH10BAC6_BH10BAC6_03260 [soil metagenome]
MDSASPVFSKDETNRSNKGQLQQYSMKKENVNIVFDDISTFPWPSVVTVSSYNNSRFEATLECGYFID